MKRLLLNILGGVLLGMGFICIMCVGAVAEWVYITERDTGVAFPWTHWLKWGQILLACVGVAAMRAAWRMEAKG